MIFEDIKDNVSLAVEIYVSDLTKFQKGTLTVFLSCTLGNCQLCRNTTIAYHVFLYIAKKKFWQPQRCTTNPFWQIV